MLQQINSFFKKLNGAALAQPNSKLDSPKTNLVLEGMAFDEFVQSSVLQTKQKITQLQTVLNRFYNDFGAMHSIEKSEMTGGPSIVDVRIRAKSSGFVRQVLDRLSYDPKLLLEGVFLPQDFGYCIHENLTQQELQENCVYIHGEHQLKQYLSIYEQWVDLTNTFFSSLDPNSWKGYQKAETSLQQQIEKIQNIKTQNEREYDWLANLVDRSLQSATPVFDLILREFRVEIANDIELQQKLTEFQSLILASREKVATLQSFCQSLERKEDQQKKRKSIQTKEFLKLLSNNLYQNPSYDKINESGLRITQSFYKAVTGRNLDHNIYISSPASSSLTYIQEFCNFRSNPDKYKQNYYTTNDPKFGYYDSSGGSLDWIDTPPDFMTEENYLQNNGVKRAVLHSLEYEQYHLKKLLGDLDKLLEMAITLGK